MFKGIARVIYYRYFLKVKWTPGYDLFTGVYWLKHNGITVRFRQCPFYDFEFDDLDYLKYISLEKPIILVDAGSFIGTLAVYLAAVSSHNYIIALEPDDKNFTDLSVNIKLNKLTNILSLKAGLWNKSGSVKFQSGRGEMSQVSASGQSIPVLTLDDLAKKLNTPITHVKMDIEGAEIEALQGARKCIQKFHPKFIIASYHIRNNQQTRIWVEKFLSKYYPRVKTTGGKQVLTVATL